MKIFIKDKVVLKHFTSQAKNDFLSLLKENSNNHLEYVFTEHEREGEENNAFNIILEPKKSGEVCIITANESEMTYFLNVFDNHYYGKMFIEYLGNGRLDLIFER